MRDSSSGRSRGFGFLTFRDPKTVNTVMVKEHYLDGKIVNNPPPLHRGPCLFLWNGYVLTISPLARSIRNVLFLEMNRKGRAKYLSEASARKQLNKISSNSSCNSVVSLTQR